MIKSYHIIKGAVENVVDEMQFKNIYEPKGWVLDERYEQIEKKSEIESIINESKTVDEKDTKVKNIATMNKKTQKKVFNDNLLKTKE